MTVKVQGLSKGEIIHNFAACKEREKKFSDVIFCEKLSVILLKSLCDAVNYILYSILSKSLCRFLSIAY